MTNTNTIDGFITPRTETSNTHTFTASEKQIKFYNDLCVQKGVTANNSHAWTSAELSAEIGKLMGMKTVVEDKMTAKQREMILSIIERNAGRLDINDYAPAWESFGKESASELVAQLFVIERQLRETMPLTDAQVSKILRMYLCPDVQFDEIGWVDKYEMYDGRKMLVLPNSEDMAEWLRGNVFFKTATEFIAKFNNLYLVWSRDRLTKEQEAHIRTLEARCANIYSAGKQVTASTDANGNVVSSVSSHSKEWNVKAFNPYTDLQLYQLSKVNASKYIEELNMTLADKELVKFPKEQMYGDRLENKRSGEGETKLTKELDKMASFVYGCFSELGEDLTYEDEQLITLDLNPGVVASIKQIIAKMIEYNIGLGRITELLEQVPNLKEAIYA